MKKGRLLSILYLFISLLLVSCQQTGEKPKEPVDYVNPYMGNISHLLVPTYPTIHLPNSMLRVYPERNDYTSVLIQGLPVVVTSHRGSSAFNLSPIHEKSDSIAPIVSYTYDLEKITPYSYEVYLDEVDISVNYAPSHQSAIYNITFRETQNNSLILNTKNGKLTYDNGAVSGFQSLDDKTNIYLYLETQQDIQSVKPINDANNQAFILNFGNEKKINLRYGISFISAEQAKKNLQREIDTYDVKMVADKGREIWNKTLSKIEIAGGNENEKTTFYTSLYRTYERMINISEDGKYYSAFDGQIHNDEGQPFYTDDWIWDTYRATHPLRALIEPKMETDMIRSYIHMAQQSSEGWMPTFPEVTGDSHRMNGNHAVAVIWDAYCKGLTNFDLEEAYNACKGAITEKTLLPWVKAPLTELDLFYQKNGYFPALHPGEKETCPLVVPWEKRQAISVILGNSYDNWCLAQIAKKLGKEEDYEKFIKMSFSYRNVFNSQTFFFHPKDKQGNFIEPFNYGLSGGQGARDYYGENNAWVYRWDVPHNIPDLLDLMGGKDNFIKNLDQTFRQSLDMEYKFQFYCQMPDHTGNVGQFSMANEPSLHIPYLYNYAGQPWKTQKCIRDLLHEWFRNDLMGIPGDEDGGGMSAFVVLSMMGFYSVTPGSPVYTIGSPVFENIRLDLGNGKYFEIKTQNYDPDNKYIQSATLNGKELNTPFFSHSDIASGGEIIFVMGNKANREWGKNN